MTDRPEPRMVDFGERAVGGGQRLRAAATPAPAPPGTGNDVPPSRLLVGALLDDRPEPGRRGEDIGEPVGAATERTLDLRPQPVRPTTPILDVVAGTVLLDDLGDRLGGPLC